MRHRNGSRERELSYSKLPLSQEKGEKKTTGSQNRLLGSIPVLGEGLKILDSQTRSLDW